MYESEDLTQRREDAKTPGKAKIFWVKPKKRFSFDSDLPLAALRPGVLALKNGI
jgi:hypothetical protein